MARCPSRLLAIGSRNCGAHPLWICIVSSKKSRFAADILGGGDLLTISFKRTIDRIIEIT